MMKAMLYKDTQGLTAVPTTPLFDRSKWETVRFGEVVELVSETSRNPEAEGITRYIGLEHLEPGSLHIKTWGELVDGVTFTKRCRKGQVLFGKRRAYQRKVAIAEFEALVSGDIYVFQAKEELLDPKLLPFICMSERFFQFAVETSAGSLSPRTNWSHLTEFEFALPPLDQQRRIAELLWAVDEVEQNYSATVQAIESAMQAEIESSLTALYEEGTTTLDQVLIESPHSGYSTVPSSEPTGHFVLSLGAITSEGYIRGQYKYAVPSKEMLSARLTKGDLLVTRSNTRALVGFAGIFDEDRSDVSFPDTMMRLPINRDLMLPEFLEVLLLSERGRLHMMSTAAGTSDSMKKINRQTLNRFKVPFVSTEQQQAFCGSLKKLRSALHQARTAMESTAVLKRQLINGLIG